MKIDKVIFSTSERFSVFWNLNAQVWKTKFNIEPVCLLFGNKRNTDMSEEYGEVIEVPILPEFPELIQITWGKFYWPIYEPDTTWLIGDIDMYPLAKDWFTTNIEHVPNDYYAHLDADGITQLNGTEFTWANKIITAANQQDRGHGTNLPAHYHCAKGSVMKIALEHSGSFNEELHHIVHSKFYNGERAYRECDPIDQHNLWCAEELRSTRAIRRSILEGKVKFTGFSLRNGIGNVDGDRLDKSTYDEHGDISEYVYKMDRLISGKYKDLHCIRPFRHYLDAKTCDKRWEATRRVLRLAGMLD